MRDDIYVDIIEVMKLQHADVIPLRTRVIADGVGISINQARYYLEEFRKLNIVERLVVGRGKITCWLLIN